MSDALIRLKLSEFFCQMAFYLEEAFLGRFDELCIQYHVEMFQLWQLWYNLLYMAYKMNSMAKNVRQTAYLSYSYRLKKE